MTTSNATYDFHAIEARWQRYWLENKTFKTFQPGDAAFEPHQGKPKFYVLDMFPYPSGVGLHVGHPLGYIATDIYARFLRMRGYNVLHPMGYDAFGLPAEQYAIEHGVPPRETTQKNIDNMRSQMQRLGLGYDWDREIATTDVTYYKWTQWIFLQLYNSWYDPAAGAARPIRELEEKLEQGKLHVNFDGRPIPAQIPVMQALSTMNPAPGAQKWSELSNEQRREVLDHQRLAYLDEVPVNWCPALGTVLANEEVTNEGRSERGNHPVFRRPLKQWMLRITAYAERLEDDLELVDWPEPIKLMQRNWIGRSEGAEVDFRVAPRTAGAPPTSPQPGRVGSAHHAAQTEGEGWAEPTLQGERWAEPTLQDDEDAETIRVYTTRPDTLFGATYMVLAPEHDLVGVLTTDDRREAVSRYIEAARNKSELDRTAETKEKTGVFTGSYAINPVNNQRIPIWIADYVLMGYGTGAIMAVPGHDTRDFEFALEFDLPIIKVVEPPPGIDWRGYTGDGVAVNSGPFDGLPTAEFKQRITAWLEEQGLGQRAVKYKLRDWLFSRQRYWGEPFPIVHEAQTGQVYPLHESELPVVLPQIDDYSPRASEDPDAPPSPPLGRAKEWAHVKGWIREDGSVQLCRPGQEPSPDVQTRAFVRELNTMPQWAGSCWYYLRYLDPINAQRFVDPDIEKYWMCGTGVSPVQHRPEAGATPTGQRPVPHPEGVDLYVGGAEHAVLHLLYARFWHKVLYDLGHVSTPEPFGRLFNQGYIQAYAYQDARGIYVDVHDVVERPVEPETRARGSRDSVWIRKSTGEPVNRNLGKMGKSLKNAISPDEICHEFGTDTLRVYEMYMGPLEASKPWSTRDIIGMSRFLHGVWRRFVAEDGSLKVMDGCGTGVPPVQHRPEAGATTTGETPVPHQPHHTAETAVPHQGKAGETPAFQADDALRRLLHKTIKRVTNDLQGLRFNTAIAALIELNNTLKGDTLPREIAEGFLKLLAPFAPHLAEELWQRVQGPAWTRSIAFETWPAYDESLTIDATIEIPVQINGKVRSRIQISPDATQEQMTAAAMADERIRQELSGKTVRKTIVVPGRMVNIVAN